MLAYFGPELLCEVKGYYLPRYQQACDRGYTQPGSKYHWLYEELLCRVLTLDQALRFLDALPKFMVSSTEDQIFQYVMNYATALFKVDRIREIPRDDQDQHPYFNDQNPYWVQMNEVLDSMGVDYDTTLIPLLFIDLSEYVVCSVRLYLQIREREIHAIDRDKFDQIMRVAGVLSSSA